MNKIMLMGAVAVVVIGGGAFYGGMQYAKASRGGMRGNFQGAIGANAGAGFRGGRPGGMGGGFTAGEILSKDDKSITIKMNDGSSKIVFYSETTEVNTFARGTASDLVVGKSISVTGAANSDGSVTAASIQLRPPMPSPTPQK